MSHSIIHWVLLTSGADSPIPFQREAHPCGKLCQFKVIRLQAPSASTTALEVRPELIESDRISMLTVIGALQSMLIIPRTPSPPPLEARDPTSLSLAEIQEMQQRLQTQTSTINKIKRERDDVREHCSPRKVARRSGRLLVQGSEGDGDVVQVTRTQ